MKKLLFLIILILTSFSCISQTLPPLEHEYGVTTPFAILDTLTTVERDALPQIKGTTIFNKDTDQLETRNSTGWANSNIVINNTLTSTATDEALSAAQGNVLKVVQDAQQAEIDLNTAKVIPSHSNYATLDGSETLTNKTINFSNNTLTNVMSLNTTQSVGAGYNKTFQANGINAGFGLRGVTATPSAANTGDIWYRTDTNRFNYKDGLNVYEIPNSDDITGISNIVEDTTPQLGGNLDTNGNDIEATDLNINVTSDLKIGDYNLSNHGLSFNIVDVTDVIYMGSTVSGFSVFGNGTARATANTNIQSISGTNNVIDIDSDNNSLDDYFLIKHNNAAIGAEDLFIVNESGVVTAPAMSIAGITDEGLKALMTSEAVDDRIAEATTNDLPTSSTLTISGNATLAYLDGLNVSTAATDITIDIPLQASVAWENNPVMTFVQQGSGSVILTFNGSELARTYEVNKPLSIYRQSSDNWIVFNKPLESERYIRTTYNQATEPTGIGTQVTNSASFVPNVPMWLNQVIDSGVTYYYWVQI